MDKSLRSAACLMSAVLLLAACSSDNKPYARESMRHPTAAEQLIGTTGGELSAAPSSSAVPAAQPASVATMTAPAAPLTMPQPVATMPSSDVVFAQQAFSSSALEVELARIAYVRTQSPDVRAFARQMLIDHRDMVIKLDNFALKRGHLVEWRIGQEKAETVERLRAIDSVSFDRAYMDEMVAAHTRAVAMLETQASSGRETATLASAVLPTVRHHLEMGRALDARL